MQLQKFQNGGYMHVKEKEETNQCCVLSKENPQLFSVLPVLVVISQANSCEFYCTQIWSPECISWSLQIAENFVPCWILLYL